MKKLINLKKIKKNTKPKQKPSKPLPAGWFNVSYQGHKVVMNHRPVWGSRPANIMGSRLREVLIEKVSDIKELPTIDELKEELRQDSSIRDEIEELFHYKLEREMSEVDYEIGIVLAFNFISEPRNIDIGTIPEMAERGLVTGGEIIERFYSQDYV